MNLTIPYSKRQKLTNLVLTLLWLMFLLIRFYDGAFTLKTYGFLALVLFYGYITFKTYTLNYLEIYNDRIMRRDPFESCVIETDHIVKVKTTNRQIILYTPDKKMRIIFRLMDDKFKAKFDQWVTDLKSESESIISA